MERNEPFIQLWAEQGERGASAGRRQMTGAGVVADEHARAVNRRQQFRNRLRTNGCFALAAPPVYLVGIAGAW